MGLKEFLPDGKQGMIQDPFDTGKVDFSVFGVRMIPVNKQASSREQNQKDGGLRLVQEGILSQFDPDDSRDSQPNVQYKHGEP